tara:strand:+ start:11121 stop:12080 length:960 start_codon:yes stop_codon:yes gene_type:complete
MAHTKSTIDRILQLDEQGYNNYQISYQVFGVKTKESTVRRIKKRYGNKPKKQGARILVFDIETAPILGAVWQLFKANIGLNQIVRDWYVMSWAAKWVGENEVMYEDIREQFDGSAESLLSIADDSEILESIWKLLDEADIVITQNGKRFDVKKLNARFLDAGMQPPSSYKHIDTLEIAKKHFAFTSNKLEYMTDRFCKKYKKLDHGKYYGYNLWKQCQLGNIDAWEEMEEYNKYDVLSLEELAFILAPWSNALPNLDMYYDDNENHCFCGCTQWEPTGYAYTNLSKFTKFKCVDCGTEKRDRVNVLTKEKRKSLKMNVV